MLYLNTILHYIKTLNKSKMTNSTNNAGISKVESISGTGSYVNKKEETWWGFTVGLSNGQFFTTRSSVPELGIEVGDKVAFRILKAAANGYAVPFAMINKVDDDIKLTDDNVTVTDLEDIKLALLDTRKTVNKTEESVEYMKKMVKKMEKQMDEMEKAMHVLMQHFFNEA